MCLLEEVAHLKQATGSQDSTVSVLSPGRTGPGHRLVPAFVPTPTQVGSLAPVPSEMGLGRPCPPLYPDSLSPDRTDVCQLMLVRMWKATRGDTTPLKHGKLQK